MANQFTKETINQKQDQARKNKTKLLEKGAILLINIKIHPGTDTDKLETGSNNCFKKISPS